MKRLQSSPRIWKRGYSSPRDVEYIFIENFYFPMNMKGMVTRKLATKPVDIPALMSNESLGDMRLYDICEKMPAPEKDICITEK